MPKIEVYADTLYNYMGRKVEGDEFVNLLSAAKAELDDKEDNILKIELNDTNRPDLWSTAGLGRQLKVYLGGERPSYPFFSREGAIKESSGRYVEVDPALENIRPYIAAFAVKGKGIDDSLLKDIIQTQEKLCWNFGQKRKAIAMGVYRSDLLKYPVKYRAADPDKTSFVPLSFDKPLSLRQIIRQHPKGEEFGHIVEGYDKYPYLEDSEGKTLSFPPVINSNDVGAVEIGDRELFIEMTGTEQYSLVLAASIVACDLADAGYEILPVKTVYQYDTPLGREVTVPYYFQKPVETEVSYVNKLLGEKFSAEEAALLGQKLGCRIEVSGNKLTLYPAEYRNDFLHPVDIIEDIMIGKGMANFDQIMPDDFTMGKLTASTLFARKVKNILVGLGFQEMVYNYLGSGKDYIAKMNIAGEDTVRISNPMSENFEYVRPSVIPCLLNSESVSGNAVYPHNIFETGKVARINSRENYGISTIDSLGFLSADRDSNFNRVSSQVSALFFYLSKDYVLEEADDPRFIPGRCARIISDGREVGIMGEIHPSVLENWGIQVPCTASEVDLSLLM